MNNLFLALFKDTIKKEVRNKMLLFSIFTSTIIILLSFAVMKTFHEMVGNQEQTIPIDAGGMILSLMFMFLNFWSVMLSVFFGVNSLRSDFVSNINYQYLTFPIKRSLYIFSRLIGTWAIVFIFYLYTYGFATLLFSFAYKKFVFNISHLASIPIMGVFVFVWILISMLLSLYINKLGSFILITFIWLFISIANNAIGSLPLEKIFIQDSIFGYFNLLVYLVLPHLEVLSKAVSGILMNQPLELKWAFEIPHFVASTLGLTYLLNYLVRKKDF